MRKIRIITFILILSCLLSGCCLVHKYEPATCTKPETCSVCGKTKGEALGHTFKDATCTEPKTCVVCAETEGEPLNHQWSKATCTAPRTCIICGATEGELAPHTWIEATCIMPKHCAVCGVTEGSMKPHQWIQANYNSPRTCAVCGITEGDKLNSYVSDNGGFNYSLFAGAKQDYSTITGYNNKTANGTVEILSYKKISSDSTHPYLEGYEWREVKVKFSMDRACRVMWGYTDIYTGLSEYAGSDYITYSDGTKEPVLAMSSFSSETLVPSVIVTPTTASTATPSPTVAATPTQSSGSTTPGTAPSYSPPVAPVLPTPSPTPAPSPTPDSQPGMYISYVTQAVRVPIRYDGLVFYVCNANYEKNHSEDNGFLYMDMN